LPRIFFCAIGAFLLLGGGRSLGQQVRVEGRFLDAEARVGEEIRYSLMSSYPRGFNILYPDSTHNFGSFQYLRRDYHPTRSSAVSSFDSVVYYLTTFELDSPQFLALPVYLAREQDCTAVVPSRDTLHLRATVTGLPAKPEFKTDTAYRKLRLQFNYPYLMAGLLALLLLALLVLLLFGRRILRWIRIYRLHKAHNRFAQRFFALMQTQEGETGQSAERLLNLWKRYLERLEGRPFTKLTTREISPLIRDSEVLEHLRMIDRVIYGNFREDQLFRRFDELLKFAGQRFQLKIEGLRKGKTADEDR
jgi:hypothetical protein